MEIQYRRNFHESYMIMEAPDGSDFYEERMMRRNDIPYLLSFRRMEVNGKAQLWYDITGMESLRDRMRRQGVSAEGLKEDMECLNGVWWEMRRFLLRQEHIYLSPDTIFFGDDGMIRLCYFPVNAADPFGQMREVMEFILTLVEEDQEETAELCYRLYDIALQEHYSFSQLLECVGAFCGRTGLQGEEATSETEEHVPRIPGETPVGTEQRAEEQTDLRGMMGGMTEESDAVGTFEREYMEIPLMEESRGHCQHSERRESLMEVVKRARGEIVSLRKVAAQIIAGEHLDFDKEEEEDAAFGGGSGSSVSGREGNRRKKGAGD